MSLSNIRMRITSTKYYKFAPPVVLLAALLYYTTLSTPILQDTDQGGLTVVLSASEAQAYLAGKAKDSSASSSDHVESETKEDKSVTRNNVDIIILNNKVYDRNKIDMKVFNDTILKKEMKRKRAHLGWPIHLNASGANALLEIDFRQYTSKDQEFLEERLGEMISRARQVGLACKDFPVELESPAGPSHLLWDKKHKPGIVWCPNYKVASTTWMINFLRLAHFNQDNPAIPDSKRKDLQYSHAFGATHDIVYHYYPTPETNEEKARILKKSVRVIIVRHPFTRLLSAYRDKMIKMHPGPSRFQFRKVQLKIISKYRPPDSPIKSRHPTFSEFARFVLDDTLNVTTAKKWRRTVKCWMPYWAQCNVCTTDYNVIMKLETMSEDEKFLITISNLKELKKLKKNEWRHLKNESSHDLATEFYSQITKEQMEGLYQRYQLDFEAFGYGIEEYLAIAKDSEGAAHITHTVGFSSSSEAVTESVMQENSEDIRSDTSISDGKVKSGHDRSKKNVRKGSKGKKKKGKHKNKNKKRKD